jgi:hypothetical protein
VIPDRRGGAGSERAASRRRPVTTVTGARQARQAARNANAAEVLSATATMVRSGHQRRTTRSNWRAQSVSVLCRRPPSASCRAEGANAVKTGSAQVRAA